MENINQNVTEESKKIIEYIKKLAPKYVVKFTHVCGTHEQVLSQYGIRTVLPKTVQLIAQFVWCLHKTSMRQLSWPLGII